MTVKILIATHKPAEFPKDDYFEPIHVGRDVAMELSKDGKISKENLQWLLANTIGDNTGDNISIKNRNYNECTAIYWAWKNYDQLCNPDYIGLMHYRRHFIFNEDYFKHKKKNLIERVYEVSFEKCITQNYIDKIGLNKLYIDKSISNTDVIVSKYTHFDLFGDVNLRTDYEKNIEGSKVEDFDLMVETILKLYPEYRNVLNKYIGGYAKLSFSMFIMKKEIFFAYCEFLFNILFEMEKYQNFENYNTNGKRTPGYIAEILLTIFIWKLEEENNTRIKYLGITKVDYPNTKFELKSILSRECPSYWLYLINKLKFLLTFKKEKKINRKKKYKNIKRLRKEYKILQKEWKEQ